MAIRRMSPLTDTTFQARSRERAARLKDATRTGKFPVDNQAGRDSKQLADRTSQAKSLKKLGDI